jgi:hypothetical protein
MPTEAIYGARDQTAGILEGLSRSVEVFASVRWMLASTGACKHPASVESGCCSH